MANLNILCFGDSLTEGWTKSGWQFSPYGNDMKAWLDTELSLTNVTIEVNGRSGDYVDERMGNFVARIESSCRKATANSKPFDWVIILGGTNDLGSGIAAETIFTSLEKVYATALKHGAQILAITVPECAAKIDSLNDRRTALNEMISAYNPKGFEKRFHTLDLFELMPYHSASEETREEIWDDGLHFTSYGYNVMGDYIAQRLVELLPWLKSGNAQASSQQGASGEVSS